MAMIGLDGGINEVESGKWKMKVENNGKVSLIFNFQFSIFNYNSIPIFFISSDAFMLWHTPSCKT
jgi:hypothetical protein